MTTGITRRISGAAAGGITIRVSGVQPSRFRAWGNSWGNSWGDTWLTILGLSALGHTARVPEPPETNITKRVSLA